MPMPMSLARSVAWLPLLFGSSGLQASVPADGYRVVVVGDSILGGSENQYVDWYQGDDRFVDFAPGRQPFFGWQGLPSSWEAIHTDVRLVAPNGWFVFADNGLPVPEIEWSALLTGLVRLLPDDRCLLLVTPFATSETAGLQFPNPLGQAHTRLALEIGEAQPCHDFVRWDLAALDRPELLSADGMHPSPDGATWLLEEVNRIVAS
jgi:hypothetical protein